MHDQGTPAESLTVSAGAIWTSHCHTNVCIVSRIGEEKSGIACWSSPIRDFWLAKMAMLLCCCHTERTPINKNAEILAARLQIDSKCLVLFLQPA